MKRISFFSVIVFLLLSVILTVGCKKKTEEKDCKTCKAWGSAGLEAEEKVCSDAQEEDFRNEFAGKEISCQ